MLSAIAKCDCGSSNSKERNKSSCVRLPHIGSSRVAIPCRRCGPRGNTPNKQLMKMTGGVELVPLLRARGLPISSIHHHHLKPSHRKLRFLRIRFELQQFLKISYKNIFVGVVLEMKKNGEKY